MQLSIEFRGQLALATDSPRTTREVEAGTRLADLLKEIAGDESDQFRKLVLDENGECGSTLFVALDGVHVRLGGTEAVPEGAREMVVMPPIAGG